MTISGISPGSNPALYFDVVATGGLKYLVSSATPQSSLFVFNQTLVPTGGNLLATGTTWKPYYNETATLLAHGPLYTIQYAADLTLCLTFSGTEASNAQLNSSAWGKSIFGLPLLFKACQYSSTNGYPALKSQLFKLIKRCRDNTYILQMWCSSTQCETGKSNYVSQLAFPPPSDANSSFALCATMNASSHLVNAPCTYDSSQQWTFPLSSSSSPPGSTQNLCPYNVEAPFNVTGPIQVISSLMTFLGCTSATLAAWSSAASNSSITSSSALTISTATLLSSSTSPLFAGVQPYCFTTGLVEVVFYDGEFSKVLLWRGVRDPYSRTTTTPAQLVQLMLGQGSAVGVWGPSGSNGKWPMGTQLQCWFRAIDIIPYQPLTLLANPISYSGYQLTSPWSLMAESDHLVVTCSLGSKYNLGRSLPNNLLSAFKNGACSYRRSFK